jgi:uncharacterized protein (TIGR03083 family)
MALDRIGAARNQRDELVAFCHTLGPQEWAGPSRCEGWSVQDVVSHMAAAAHGVFTPWMFKLMRTKSVERSNDTDAAARRAWAPDRVLAEYETWSTRMVKLLAAAQRPPLSLVPFKLGELGFYPMALVASAIVFDTHTHLHYDIAPALGRSLPDPEPERMAVVNEWVMESIPRMSRHGLSFLDRPITITLDGAGGGSWCVVPRPGGAHPARIRPAPVPGSAAHITGRADEFSLWATRRRSWRDQDVKIDGDEPYATRFLDAVTVV